MLETLSEESLSGSFRSLLETENTAVEFIMLIYSIFSPDKMCRIEFVFCTAVYKTIIETS